MKPKIVSEIKINGKWMPQEKIPPEIVEKIVEDTIKRAAANIGCTVAPKEKSA